METHTRDERYDVVLIGAGLSGISAAHALRQRGVDALVLEKETRIAEPWRRRHPQLRLNTHRRLSSLPGHALPADGPAFPSRDEVIGYLERYAEVTQANIRFGIAVEGLRRSGGQWAVETKSGLIHARHVVFATGKEHKPNIPDWPGRKKWRGRLVHSAELGDVTQYFDKDVLIVGAGNSGTDILNHLARIPTRSLHVSIRRGSVVIPTWFLGFPVQLGSPVMVKLPTRLLDAVLAATERLAFGNLRRYGMPRRDGGATRLERETVAPAIDRGFIAALKAGKARIVAAVSHFDGNAVVLKDGRRLQPDVIIAATGYDTGLDGILADMDALDERGLPITGKNGEALHVPDLWFAGMAPPLTGMFWAARHNSGPMAEAIQRQLGADRSTRSRQNDLNHQTRERKTNVNCHPSRT